MRRFQYIYSKKLFLIDDTNIIKDEIAMTLEIWINMQYYLGISIFLLLNSTINLFLNFSSRGRKVFFINYKLCLTTCRPPLILSYALFITEMKQVLWDVVLLLKILLDSFNFHLKISLQFSFVWNANWILWYASSNWYWSSFQLINYLNALC